VTLDTSIMTGRQLLQELLQRADVLLHDCSPERLTRQHLDVSELRRTFPHLIATAVTSYGQTGPYSDYEGVDITSCALSGLSEGLGENDRPPLVAPLGQPGYQAGLSWRSWCGNIAVRGKRSILAKQMCWPRCKPACI
jgi:crotonobetainyl-CoA:carnitine CoA-transferase CaiB-like acyl-CoA transferase